MTSILDRFSPASKGFVPRTPQDLFALRLAQKLDDVNAAAHYAMLATIHSEGRLLTAYRRTLRHAANGDRGRGFQKELEHAGDHNGNYLSNLLAVRIERRSVAAAVFYGSHIEYTQMRQLASSKEKALESAVNFINWLLARFPIESAALEGLPMANEIQRKLLAGAITRALRERMLPIWEIPKATLFEACGYPPLKSRKELREVVAGIWPVLAGTNGKAFVRDAVALGMYVQTERLFTIN